MLENEEVMSGHWSQKIWRRPPSLKLGQAQITINNKHIITSATIFGRLLKGIYALTFQD